MPAEIQYPQEIAFYYPGHLWGEPEWIKSLLLFFDGIGLLVPEYKQHEPEMIDPVLAGPLRDKKLLHYLVADQVVDKEATKLLTTAMADVVASGAFDNLSRDGTAFHTISMSRMGYFGDERLADELFEALRRRGLARKSEDGASVPLHPLVRYLILTLLAQILRSKGSQSGLELSPATDRPEIAQALTELLNLPQLPTSGQVVAADLQAVSVDLSSVPLDEVLAYRTEHLKVHRKYIRSVRAFARLLSLLPPADRAAALRDRREEIRDLADDLGKKARSAWRRPVSFSLGVAGGLFSAVTNPIGGALSLSGLFARGYEMSSNEAGAFTYLFASQQEFPGDHRNR